MDAGVAWSLDVYRPSGISQTPYHNTTMPGKARVGQRGLGTSRPWSAGPCCVCVAGGVWP